MKTKILNPMNFGLLILFLLPCLFMGNVYGGERYEISPKYYDFNPNDGFMDRGTDSNPYVIKDRRGHKIGEIKPKYYDFNPNDGFMDRGTDDNPYVIEFDD